MKELINKYIGNIKIADDCIGVNAISDLDTNGCGGAIHLISTTGLLKK
ncbi:MAG: hypothetical protein ACOX7U_03960 [Desulfitobacteriia bacterium]|jgi:hypothetical protein